MSSPSDFIQVPNTPEDFGIYLGGNTYMFPPDYSSLIIDLEKEITHVPMLIEGFNYSMRHRAIGRPAVMAEILHDEIGKVHSAFRTLKEYIAAQEND